MASATAYPHTAGSPSQHGVGEAGDLVTEDAGVVPDVGVVIAAAESRAVGVTMGPEGGPLA